jgi:hypothetical protein
MMQGYTVDQLVRLASAGAGFAINAQQGFHVEDLVRVASAAAGRGARITIRNYRFTLDEMIRIASAGQGAIVFDP